MRQRIGRHLLYISARPARVRLWNLEETDSPGLGGYHDVVSPTVFREGRYRFFFFSLEESRMHIHVFAPEGEAKFWLEPAVELAVSKGIPQHELRVIGRIVERRRHDIATAWREHFGS
jgi:hypothetical protein